MLFLLACKKLLTSYHPDQYTDHHWQELSLFLPNTTAESLKYKWLSLRHKSTNFQNFWSLHDDYLLMQIIYENEPALLDPNVSKPKIKWSVVAMKFNHRTKGNKLGKHCKERWYNHLSPNLNKTVWTDEEDILLLENAIVHNKKWAKITQFLPGRTQHNVKNRFLSLIAREHKISCKKLSFKENCCKSMILTTLCRLKKRYNFQKKENNSNSQTTTIPANISEFPAFFSPEGLKTMNAPVMINNMGAPLTTTLPNNVNSLHAINLMKNMAMANIPMQNMNPLLTANNPMNTMNMMNPINDMSAINQNIMNTMTAANTTANSMSSMNTMNTMNAMNSMNLMNTQMNTVSMNTPTMTQMNPTMNAMSQMNSAMNVINPMNTVSSMNAAMNSAISPMNPQITTIKNVNNINEINAMSLQPVNEPNSSVENIQNINNDIMMAENQLMDLDGQPLPLLMPLKEMVVVPDFQVQKNNDSSPEKKEETSNNIKAFEPLNLGLTSHIQQILAQDETPSNNNAFKAFEFKINEDMQKNISYSDKSFNETLGEMMFNLEPRAEEEGEISNDIKVLDGFDGKEIEIFEDSHDIFEFKF